MCSAASDIPSQASLPNVQAMETGAEAGRQGSLGRVHLELRPIEGHGTTMCSRQLPSGKKALWTVQYECSHTPS